MGVASSLPTGTESCTPAFIVFRRDAAGTYTPYTFGNIQELGRWAIDTVTEVMTTAPTTTPTSTVITHAPIAPIGILDWKKNTDGIKKIADEIFNLPIRGSYNNFGVLIDEKNIIKLTSIEIGVILTLFKEKPALIAEKLFPGLKKEHIQYLNQWGFIEAVDPDLIHLEKALKSYITIEEALVENNEFLFVVKRLHNYLIEGLHHISWRSSMPLLKFDDVGMWTDKSAPIILEECLRSWLTSEKPSDSIRNFFIQTYLVQNYRRLDGLGTRLLSESSEVSSSCFLKGFTDTMNDESSVISGIPSVFTKWVAKGVSYTNCKNALSQMGVEQIRKASGQFYKNIIPETCKEINYLVPKEASHNFRTFDSGGMLDSVIDDSLNAFDAPPPQTKDTNPLLTSDFNKILKEGLLGSDTYPMVDFNPISPQDIYTKLLRNLHKEAPNTTKQSDETGVQHRSDCGSAERLLPKPASTHLESVWTQTSETRITLVE